MIFHEIYGCYYRTVARILTMAVDGQLTSDKMRRIVRETAFLESGLTIIPALESGRWPLLAASQHTSPKAAPAHIPPRAASQHTAPKAAPAHTPPRAAPLHTPLKAAPDIPLSLLEKRWLKAILLDPRMRLFFDVDRDADAPDGVAAMLSEVEPLFTPEDYVIFDKYKDGDPYTDPGYIRRFRQILDAIRRQNIMRFTFHNRKGRLCTHVGLPEGLEYSEKDDKFRVLVRLRGQREPINLGRLCACTVLQDGVKVSDNDETEALCSACEAFTMELVDERNALERVLLHFAHFRKEARRLEDSRYAVTVYYDRGDETELVIRVLSFGPLVKVTEPETFINLIKERLKMQMRCGLR